MQQYSAIHKSMHHQPHHEASNIVDFSYQNYDPEQFLLNRIFGAMTKKPEMMLGISKGMNYKGFLDWKHAKLLM